MRPVKLAVLALALVLAACGGDDGDEGSGTTATSTSVTAVETTPTAGEPGTTAGDDAAGTTTGSATTAGGAAGGDDQALAESLLLTEDDLGPGWTATPAEGDDGSGGSPLDECVADAGALDIEPLAEADSPDFSQGTTQVSSSASVFESPDVVADQLEVFTSPEVPGCVTRLLEEDLTPTLPDGVTIEGFGFEAVDYEPVAETGFAFQGGGTIVAGTQEQPFTIVIIGDSAGRAGVSVIFQFLGEADGTLIDEVWAAMEEKLERVE